MYYPNPMRESLNNAEVNKQLIKSEPYVIYSGFELGRFPKLSALKELRHALESFYQVVILVEDKTFSDDLLDFIRDGSIQQESLAEDIDLDIYQKANMLIETQLVSSLPKEVTHPALLHIRNTFEEETKERVAPRLVKSQLQSWGLEHKRIKAFSRTKLEIEVQ